MAIPASDPSARRTREQRILSGAALAATWSWRIVGLALAAVLFGFVVMETWSVLLPIILAVLLCTALAPISGLIQRLGLPRAVGALGAVIAALLVMFGLAAVVAPSIAPQVAELADSATRGLDDLRTFLRDGPLGVTDAKFNELLSNAQQRVSDSADMIATSLLITLGALTSGLVNLLLTVVLAFMFLKDGHRFLPWLRGAAGPTAGRHLSEVLLRVWTTIASFVRTQALVGLIDAVLIGAGLLVLGVPLALPLALLTFVAAFAPIVGAVTVGALAVLVALVSNGPLTALLVAILVLVVQQLEGNVLLPWLQGRSLGLHAAVVLLAIVLGSTLFGVVGAFLSVPVVASLSVILTYLGEQAAGIGAPEAAEDDSAPDPDPAAEPEKQQEPEPEA